MLKIERAKETLEAGPGVEELQKKIDEQTASNLSKYQFLIQLAIKTMTKERKQLKQYVVRYESELLRNEHQVAVLVNKVKELEVSAPAYILMKVGAAI